MATYVSYDVARRTAPPDERAKFGQGSYEGIVAALSLQGVRVGPLIHQDHPGLLPYIYGVLVLSNFVMYGAALLLIRPVVRLFSLPREMLMPIIAVVCVLGAFGLNLSMFDVSVMFVFGVTGLVLQRAGFPLAPMVLGAILGSMVDENLRRALVLFEHQPMALFGRPLGLALLALILFTLYDGIYRAGRVPRHPGRGS